MNEQERRDHYAWHVRLNQISEQLGHDKMRWMYAAKEVAEESSRLPYWFKLEREGKLPELHRQCSRSPDEPIQDNHLTCCLGIECRKCEFLVALNDLPVSGEELDRIKTWTCVTHILKESAIRGFVDTSEGMILTVDDRMFWDNVYTSLAAYDESEDK
jgi:hypothetical protein